MPFAPTDISGCQLWLKADAGVYKDAGSTLASHLDTCQQWNDQSGNGNHYSQATAGSRPTFATSGGPSDVINGLPILSFDGGDFLGSLGVSNPFTVFVVYAPTGGTRGRALHGSNNWLVGIYDQRHTAYQGAFQQPSFSDMINYGGEMKRVCVTNDGSTGKFYKSGNLQNSSGSATTAPGSLFVGGSTEAFIGWIGEVIVYNSVLSDADRQSVDAYLYGRWGHGQLGIGPGGVSGCRLWLRSDMGVYSDAGSTPAVADDLVYQWNDQSGYDLHFVQATSGNRPQYKTGVTVGGSPAIRFDGSNDWMGSHVLDCPYSVCVVYCERGSASGNHRAIMGSVNWLMGPYGGKHRYYRGDAQGQFADNNDQAVSDGGIVRAQGDNDDNNTSRYYLNGTDDTGTAAGCGIPQTLYLGGVAPPGSNSEPHLGDIFQVAIFDHVLSSGERATVDGWLDDWLNGITPGGSGVRSWVGGMLG